LTNQKKKNNKTKKSGDNVIVANTRKPVDNKIAPKKPGHKTKEFKREKPASEPAAVRKPIIIKK
jgi:hypothetical protein